MFVPFFFVEKKCSFVCLSNGWERETVIWLWQEISIVILKWLKIRIIFFSSCKGQHSLYEKLWVWNLDK